MPQRDLASNQPYQIGQFFWSPALYLFGEHQQYALRSDYNRSRGSYEYRVNRIREDEFNNRGTPNNTLGIKSDERAMVVKAKRRLVVLISRAGTGRADSFRAEDECFLVAPVYSFGADETQIVFSQDFIERVKAYVYWQFFYLPAHTNFWIRESFIRLDRIQAVHKNLLTRRPVMLSMDAQYLLQSWTRVYLGEELDTVNGMLFDHREQAIAAPT